jgi:predicted permease
LILLQVALTVVLLFGASLFTRSLRKLRAVDLGYDIDRVLAVRVDRAGPRETSKPAGTAPAPGGEPSKPANTAFALDEALSRVRQIPGVESTALSKPGVLSAESWGGTLKAEHGSGETGEITAHFLWASPGYFSTMRMPLLRGRDFTAADRTGSPEVMIINQRLASQLWPDQNPIGRHAGGRAGNSEVIGVVGNSKYGNVREETLPIAYSAFAQAPFEDGTLEIRCRGPVAAVEREVRNIVKFAAPGYQVSDATTMERLRDSHIAQDRLLAFLSNLFGVFGTALAMVGIYGLISYSVTRRTREVGIRMSVGAQRGSVLWLFLRESLTLVAAGVLLGMPLALLLARFVGKMLYGVTTSDPPAIAATLVLLALGGLLASYIPGRRATRVNPVDALRCE